MPTYTFENKKTGEEHTDMMSYDDMVKFLIRNKHFRQVITAINIVGGVQGISYKQDSGWKENLSRIAEAHPTSPLGQQYGKRTAKDIATSQVLTKHRKMQADKKKRK